MNANDKDDSSPMVAGELTLEQIRRNMLGLTTDSESVVFERQLASKPGVADVAKEIVPDDFVVKVKLAFNELKLRSK